MSSGQSSDGNGRPPDELAVVAERFHQRFFGAVPLPSGTSFESLTGTTCGFNVAGPESRAMLQRLTASSLASEDFPFMRNQRIEVAGIPVLALRVSFTGDLGWELHCAEADQTSLYAALIEAGREFGAGPVGSRALMALRLEKGYGSWGREYSPEYWPQEVGLDRLIRLDKDFLNKRAYLAARDKPPREVLRLLHVTEVDTADASGGEPVFLPDGTPAGRVTSGAYGHGVDMSLALAVMKAGAPGDAVDVMILGRPHRAVILDRPPFDPDGLRLRG